VSFMFSGGTQLTWVSTGSMKFFDILNCYGKVCDGGAMRKRLVVTAVVVFAGLVMFLSRHDSAEVLANRVLRLVAPESMAGGK